MKKLLIFLLLVSTVQAQDFRYAITPTGQFNTTVTGSMGAFAVDASNTSLGYILQAPEAATITQLCYTYGARTGTPPTYKIGLEGVTAATGIADGVYKTGTGECSATFTPPADATQDGTQQCKTLTGTTCALTRGQDFAITIKYSSGTVSALNNGSFVYRQTIATNDAQDFVADNSEYSYTITLAGAAAKQQYNPVIVYKNGSRTFGYPLTNFGSVAFSVDTTPDEYALAFQYPCPAGQTFQISGVSAVMKTPATGKTVKFQLYTGTTLLQTYTYNSDRNSAGAAAARNIRAYFSDSSLTSLSCATTYRIALQPQETTSGLELYYNDVSANSDLDAWPLGVNAYISSRTDAGAWSDTTTRRPRIGLIINKLNTVTSGGLLNNNTTSGGVQ